MKNFKSLILIGAILLVSSIFNTTYADYSCDQTQDFSFKLREGVNYRLHDYAYNLGSTDFVINGAYMAGLASSNFDSLGTPYTLNAGSRDVMYFKSKGYDNNQGLSFSQSTFGKSFNWWIILDGKYVGTNTAIRLCENVKFDITKCGDGNLDKNTDGYLGGQGSWTSEQCDDGSANSNTTPGSCKLDCSGRVPQNDPKYDIYQCQDNGNWSKTASSVTQTQGSSYNSNQNYDRTSVVWVNEGASAPNDATCKDPTTPVNGVCSQTEVGKCIVGTASNDNNNNSCSEIRTWKCESSNNGTTADCFHANATCGTTPSCGDGIKNGSEQCDYNDASHNNWGNGNPGCNISCQQVNITTDPNDKPVRQCTANGWIKTDKRWNWANYAANGHYQVGNEASLNEGETPANTTCGEGANTKPVRQCTANGWIKTNTKWNWANYDKNKVYNLNDEASLNEGETPTSLNCGPVSYAQLRMTKTADKSTVLSGDLVTYTITMYNDGPGIITNSAISDVLPAGMKFVSSDRGHHIVDKNGYTVRNDVGFKREVLADGQRYYKGAYDGDGPTDIVCTTAGKPTITDPKDLFYPGKKLCYQTNTYDWWLSYGVNDYRGWGPYDDGTWMKRQYLPDDTLVWFWGNIEAGGSRTLTVTARYDGSKNGQCMINTTTGSMDTPEYPRNAVNDSASATVCAGVQPTVDVQITKAVDKTGFINNTGEIITWTLNYKNNGPATATGVVVSDIVPKQLTYLMGSVDGSKYTFTANPTASGTTELIWIFKQPLSAGATGSFTVTTQYRGGHPDGQPIINATAIVATNDSDPTNNTDTETTKPYSSPVLGSLGDRVWIDADKDGVQDADEVSLSGVKVDLLTCTGTVLATTTTNGSGFYLFTGLTAGNYKVRFTIPTGYVWTSKGTGTTTDSDVNVDGSTDCIVLGVGEHRRDIDAGVVTGSTSQADVQVTKSVDKVTFPNNSGETITWTLNYKNNGPTAVTNAVITDELPSSMKFVSAVPTPNATGTMMYFIPGVRYGCFPSPTNPAQIVCGDPGPIYNGVRWNIGNLAVGQTGTITLTTKYLGGVANGSGIVNKVSITVAETETRYDNNSGSAVTTPYSSGTIGTASLGNYVWIDADKDGVQDANEVSLSGVKVDLYKISSCTADLSGVLMTTTTNASGFYLFTGLDAGSYKVKFTLPNGYEFTMPNQGSDDAVDSDAGLNGVTSCIELQQGENNMTVDAGVVLNQPISCEGLTLSTTSMSVGGTVNYTCSHKNATSAVVTVTSSGSMTGVVSMTGFTGQFTLSQAGVYNVQCTLDNGITYKVVSYAATGTAINCAYKAQANNVNMCAMKASLDPYLTSGVNLSGLIYMPTPYPYCTDAQIADTSYACVAAPAGSQILTRQDNMCRAQLTVTAGGGGCTSNCGGSTYNFCGDGAINSSSEQCDDGNRVNGDGCNSSCQREGSTPSTPSSPTKPTNAIKVKTGSSLLCDSIDPPSVNMKEYLPFWWSMESDSDVKIVSDCSQSENGKTNIVNGSDAEDNPICHFEMRNGLGETSRFSRPCFEKTNLKQYPLFQSFFNTRPVSDGDYSDIYNSSTLGGTSYFGPSNWGEADFTALGEYSLSLYKTTFKQCKGVASGSRIIWSEDPTRYESKNDAGFDRTCSFNFTVTTPYFVQDGLSLSTTPLDASIIESFHGFTTANQIISNIKENSSYNGNSNLLYLQKAFVEKYKRLATSDKAPNGVSLPAGFTKVPGKDIYVYTRPTNLSGGPLTVQPIDRNTPINGTLISTDTDLVINGDVDGIAMIIAPNNTIDFRTTDSEYNKVQSIDGIYIANKITSSTKIFNGNLGNTTWASKGGIRLKGVMISANAKDDIRKLVLSRRSYLGTWFDTDKPGVFEETNKRKAILEGAAFTIETDPSFWTKLPPGANELMSALETYK